MTMFGRVWLAAAFVVAALAARSRADLIVLRDGHEYDGILVRATAAEIVFRVGDREVTYPRADVLHVRLQKQREWDGLTAAADIPDAALKEALARPVDPGQYPGAGTLTLLDSTTVRLDSPQTWQRQRRSIVRILNEHGEGASVREVLYRKDADQVQIRHGVSIRPDGSVVHLRDTAVQDESLYSAYPRYDRMGRVRFALPEGKPGVVLDSAVEVRRDRPLPDATYAEEFVLGGADPACSLQVAVFAPAGCPLRWQVTNDPDGAVRHEQAAEEGGTWHRWRRSDSPQVLPEPMMPPWADVVPRLVVSAQAGDWAAVAAEYQTALDALDSRYTSLPAPPAGSVDELWDAVSRQVQPVGISLGCTGYLPGDPAETWRLRYGAALDRAYLLYRWLKASGVPAVEWVWVRPRGAGGLVAEVPALGVFSQPAVRIGGASPRLLVPGGDTDTADEMAAQLGASPCLAVGKGVERLPLAPAAALGQDRLVRLDLDADGNAGVTETLTLRGAECRSLREWRRLTADEIRNAVEGRVRQVDARATDLQHRVVGDVTRNEPTITLELTYRIPGFADRRPTLCSFLPPWLDYDASSVGRDRRQFPLFWPQARADSVRLEVHWPAALAGYALPEARGADAGLARLEVTAGSGPDQATLSVAYCRSAVDGRADDYPALKACLQARAALGRQYWVLRSAQR